MKYCSQSVILSKQFTLLSIFLIKFEEISTADNSAIKFYYEKKIANLIKGWQFFSVIATT
jgi:hypothetical protein